MREMCCLQKLLHGFIGINSFQIQEAKTKRRIQSVLYVDRAGQVFDRLFFSYIFLHFSDSPNFPALFLKNTLKNTE